ncbi:dihydroxyacetone kinase subunit DhaK, partial [Deinococcus sp.]|uniref:dihydroxyacetone kinase subunit DhaK n=1 Tax=Deinococcus sp. TaxID=47478 RepID=UPI002869D877
MIFAFKVAGARADQGGSLDEVEAAAVKALAHTRTMGVALSSCTLPAAGKPTFEIGEGEMEIGMGIHGEKGVRRGPLESADEIAVELLDAVLTELDVKSGDRLAVMVNGLGATPPEELYILYRRVHRSLEERGVAVHQAFEGEYATSLEMAGASLTVMKLDDELTGLLDHPARTPFFVQVGK